MIQTITLVSTPLNSTSGTSTGWGNVTSSTDTGTAGGFYEMYISNMPGYEAIASGYYDFDYTPPIEKAIKRAHALRPVRLPRSHPRSAPLRCARSHC